MTSDRKFDEKIEMTSDRKVEKWQQASTEEAVPRGRGNCGVEQAPLQ